MFCSFNRYLTYRYINNFYVATKSKCVAILFGFKVQMCSDKVQMCSDTILKPPVFIVVSAKVIEHINRYALIQASKFSLLVSRSQAPSILFSTQAKIGK
jgi:hypothetical protein